jgi:hypothetical protein
MINNELQEYTEFDQIPDRIDHVIEFQPCVPPPPHTDADHNEIDSWQSRFQELMEREYASSSKTR